MRNCCLTRAKAVACTLLLFIFSGACTKPWNFSDYSIKSCPKLIGKFELADSEMAIVNKIADGDTFTACVPSLKASIRVRILGIDCPESHVNAKCKADKNRGQEGCKEQIPKGLKAAQIAEDALLGKKVRLESPNRDGHFKIDHYGRVLAYIRMDNGEDFGRFLIQNGFCDNYDWKYPHPRGEEYESVSRM